MRAANKVAHTSADVARYISVDVRKVLKAGVTYTEQEVMMAIKDLTAVYGYHPDSVVVSLTINETLKEEYTKGKLMYRLFETGDRNRWASTKAEGSMAWNVKED